VDVEWVEGDTQALPFGDGEFDVVTSCFGAMFAPDHRKVAGELLRVCRPGGTIGLAAFTPEGLGGAFFEAFGPFAHPPPAGAEPPITWGSERHVRDLLGDRVAALELTRWVYVERAESPRGWVELYTRAFGPVVAIRASLAGEPERARAFDDAFLEFAVRANQGDADGPAEYPFEYLVAVARTRAVTDPS
jgi:2-polyprenyl-6-hydroxyphenyl methylase/3-demethylubiquinone-9 3-methyltransferase